MILVLIFLLVAVCMVLAVTRRNRESLLMLGLCASLAIQWAATLVYMAKKGGITTEVQLFLFLTAQIKTKMQYLMCTLGQLGYVLAVGRYLFPLFLMQLALSYTMSPRLRGRRWLSWGAGALPVLALVLYYPPVFRQIDSLRWQRFIVQFTQWWLVLYVAAALLILLWEYRSTTIPFFRRQFGRKVVLLLSLSGLYLLYCRQDPAQIYLFYRGDYTWLRGLTYLTPNITLRGYVFAMAVSVLCSLVGFTTLVQYTQTGMRENQSDIVMQRKFDIASEGASVFVHSIKNQLLANRVVHKRLAALAAQEQPDKEAMEQYIRSLQETNEMMLQRVEELYASVKSKSIFLIPTPVERVAEAAKGRFLRKYPQGKVEVVYRMEPSGQILADCTHLSEALYNLLVNGWEATTAAGREEPVRLIFQQERIYTVVEVADQGVGIPPEEAGRIFEPFYSHKNSNYNWGMGLYYVRAIVKSHLGLLRMESRPGEGSQFFVMLPRYEPK